LSRPRAAREAVLPAEARVPEGPEPVPRGHALPPRDDDVPQRVHDREGEDGPGAVRARRRVPVLVVRDHVLREAPRRCGRRRGAGRRVRLPLRRRRDGGRRVPALLPVRAHLPERPPVPALRGARPRAAAGRQQEATDRPQRRLPGHLARRWLQSSFVLLITATVPVDAADRFQVGYVGEAPLFFFSFWVR
jgi:hypothetical protein